MHCVSCRQPGLLQVQLHTFWACNMSAMFQRLMQNCLGELNITYCLIYLDDIITFSQTADEHLHCLCVVFDQFREHNLKLRLSICNLFRNEITYLAHAVLKDWVCPSHSNLKAIAECIPPQTYTKVYAFLSLVGHYRRLTKGFMYITQALSTSPGKGPARSQSGCHLQRIT